MLIDIRNVKSCWCTCDRDRLVNRQKEFTQIFNELDLYPLQVNGPITDNYFLGVAIGYREALSYFDPPFIIYEDDCRPTKDFSYTYDIPINIDALYLGISPYSVKGFTIQPVEFESYNNFYNKIINMTSFHSILYLSKKYVDNCITLMDEYINHHDEYYSVDGLISNHQNEYNILGLKKPSFYQKDGHNDEATKRYM